MNPAPVVLPTSSVVSRLAIVSRISPVSVSAHHVEQAIYVQDSCDWRLGHGKDFYYKKIRARRIHFQL